MKKLAKIMAYAVVTGIVSWSAIPTLHQNADFMGPGPKSIAPLDLQTSDIMGPGPMSIAPFDLQTADIMGPGPMSIPQHVATNMGPEPMTIQQKNFKA